MTLADAVRDWAPEPVERTDTVHAGPVAALAGLLDQEPPPEEVPPLWHWVFFLDRAAQRDLGPDGHLRAGRFLPPIPDRRRMYAGGRWTSHVPIRLGDRLTRRSALASITPKTGRTGELLFTTVRHEYVRPDDGTLVAVEEQDAVYRSGDPDPVPRAAPAGAPAATGPWRLEFTADPVLLFRFSALTYNAHRIHYDHAYATQVEGHAGLVVHGPLLALLLAELPRRAGRPVRSLEFRLRAPVYAGQPIVLTGGAELCAHGPSGIAATMRWE